jgi:protein translocase SecG subunit
VPAADPKVGGFFIAFGADCAKKALVLYSLVMTLGGILPYIQIVLSILLIGCILLQQTGASLGGAFGGDNFSAAFHTRRGSEKVLFYASIILGILFALSCIVALMLNK